MSDYIQTDKNDSGNRRIVAKITTHDGESIYDQHTLKVGDTVDFRCV